MYQPLFVSTEQNIPSNMVTMDDIPPGAEAKNRYRNVLPSETPQFLTVVCTHARRM